MKQHPIPQNIMDVEFKLVGDLTLRQFIYLGVGGAIAYAAFISGLSFLPKWGTIILFSGSALAFAFIPVNDRSLDVWLINFAKAVAKPQRQVWRKTATLPEFLLTETKQKIATKQEKTLAGTDRERLTKYLKGVPAKEKEKDEVDEREKEFLAHLKFERPLPIKEELEIEKKLREQKTEEKKETLATQINYSNQPVYTVYTSDRVPTFKTALSNVRVGRALKEVFPTKLETKPLFLEKVRPPKPPEEEKIASAAPETKEERAKRNEQLLTEIKSMMGRLKSYSVEGPKIPSAEATVTAPTSVKEPPKEKGFNLKDLFRHRPPDSPQKKKEVKIPVTKKQAKSTQITLKPKKSFFDLLKTRGEKDTLQPPPEKPPSEAAGKLPPEKALKREETKERRAATDFEKTIDYYRREIQRLQEEKESLAHKIGDRTKGERPVREASEKIKKEYLEQLEEMKRQNKELKEMIQRTQDSLKQEKQKEAHLASKAETFNRQLAEQEALLTALRKEKSSLSERLKFGAEEKQKEEIPEEKKLEKKAEEKLKKIEREEPKKGMEAKVPKISDKPNVINGVVKDATGNLVEGAIIIVKDKKGEPVRALRTNNLGQFAITTPLPNGRYQVTVEKTGLSFDIIEVEVTGTILKPVTFEDREST